jgi:hypothetical protein
MRFDLDDTLLLTTDQNCHIFALPSMLFRNSLHMKTLCIGKEAIYCLSPTDGLAENQSSEPTYNIVEYNFSPGQTEAQKPPRIRPGDPFDAEYYF